MKLNLDKIDKKNICLIGLMGSGKSIIGKLLSKNLNLLHFDSDSIGTYCIVMLEWLQITNKSISIYFIKSS